MIGATCLALVLIGMVAIVLLVGPWSFSPMHHANQRSAEENAAQVERYCGKARADAFRATHDPDDDTEGPMQEWVKRCLTGDGR